MIKYTSIDLEYFVPVQVSLHKSNSKLEFPIDYLVEAYQILAGSIRQFIEETIDILTNFHFDFILRPQLYNVAIYLVSNFLVCFQTGCTGFLEMSEVKAMIYKD